MARLFDDGASEALSRGAALVSARPLTMACWFYTDDLTITNTLMCIDDSTQNPGLDGFALDVSGTEGGDPVRAWAQQNGGATDFAKSTAGPGANAWHHACGVFDASYTKVFLDAANTHSVGATANPVAPDETAIGRRYSGGAYSAYMSGRVAEAAIWNASLLAGQVEALAAGYRPLLVRPQNIVAYWPLIRDQDYDLVGGFAMTPINGPSIAAHAPIIYGPAFYAMSLLPASKYFIGRIGRLGGRANVPVTDIDDHANMLFQTSRDFYAE